MTEHEEPLHEELVPTDEGVLVEQIRPVVRGDFRYTLHDRDGTIIAEHPAEVAITPGAFILHDNRRYLVVDNVPDDSRFTHPDFDGYAVRAD